MTGTIYFAQAGESGPIKIGYTSSSPEERIAALQTGCPLPMRLVAIRQGTVDHERYLHNLFTQHRMGGEWFAPSDDLLSFLESNTGLPPVTQPGNGCIMLWIRTRKFRCGQAEFAKIADTTQPTVSRWERGEFDPNLRNLRFIREAAIERGVQWDDRLFFEVPQESAA